MKNSDFFFFKFYIMPYDSSYEKKADQMGMTDLEATRHLEGWQTTS